jgi:hypothetical protein
MGRLQNIGKYWRETLLAATAGLITALAAPMPACFAYTAAGDRIFVANGILPQIAPTDQVYTWAWTVPQPGGAVGVPTEATNVGGVLEKRLTERLGLHLEDSWFRIDRYRAGSRHGFANLETELKYLLLDDHDREALLSFGVDREWGGTGALAVGSPRQGATAPRLYFGKGLGDLDIGYLRPFALSGFFGYQFSDAAPRPDLITTGLKLEYSIPYLQSKVQSFELPELVRRMTPMAEVSFAVPSGRSFGARTAILVAPGVNIAGDGWEFLIEALVPATRASGTGVGVRGALHLSLDFLFPDTIGRPLFAQQ